MLEQRNWIQKISENVDKFLKILASKINSEIHLNNKTNQTYTLKTHPYYKKIPYRPDHNTLSVGWSVIIIVTIKNLKTDLSVNPLSTAAVCTPWPFSYIAVFCLAPATKLYKKIGRLI